ncbi:MAG: 6-phosphofructokinase [Oscillospiraceae bacterium]|nr:6-phosphofructokinase [Oscillospiraceae bacterium]
MNIAVAQSGGPTCAINASLVGVFKQGLLTGEIDAIFGSINGIEGMIEDELINLKSIIRTNEDMELLRQTPSTMLGSCRYKLPAFEDDPAVYEKIVKTLETHRIGIFIYIGGNDSMDTVVKLSRYLSHIGSDVRVVGVPKTIDNDLPVTDHTPGFGSAAKYVAATAQEIIRDSSVYSIPSVTIIEVMGRHSGFLAASTCLLRANGEEAPHLIYLPECEFSPEAFIEDVRKEMAKHKAVVVAVSEGVTLPEEGAEGYQSGATDVFGHKYLSGVGKYLERLVADRIGCKVRSIELNVMQRCSSHICSKTDIDEAERIGRHALRAALDGQTGKMMYFHRVSDMPYAVSIEMTDAANVANLEKMFPKEWITPERNQVTDAAISYFLPLIQGEVDILMKNGMPVHFQRPLQMR